jgi:hypothetical integral membrane protein (TIGR02206 family)
MDLHTFEPGSATHLATLLVCVGLAVGLATAGAALRGRAAALRRVRIALAVGCVAVWCLSSAFWIVAAEFRWDQALPLQFCNVANLIGAWAVATRRRIAQALLYFWCFALCSCAFLTPLLFQGPASFWFWIFWSYHLFIALATAWVLGVDRFRPGWGDAARALAWTLAYAAALFALNLATGWNYGFLGRGVPGQPSLIDFLGPWPLRLLWMGLIGSALFLALVLPWRLARLGRRGRPAAV